MQRRAEPGNGSHGALPARPAPTDVDPEVVAGARPAGSLNSSRVAEVRCPASPARRGPLRGGEGDTTAFTGPRLRRAVREPVAGTSMVDSINIRWAHGPAGSLKPQVADPAP